MGRSWISDRESIQGHFALVHPVPMDSQDGSLNTLQSNETSFGCVNEIVMLVLVNFIVVYM